MAVLAHAVELPGGPSHGPATYQDGVSPIQRWSGRHRVASSWTFLAYAGSLSIYGTGGIAGP
jgi:hypothetical protein